MKTKAMRRCVALTALAGALCACSMPLQSAPTPLPTVMLDGSAPASHATQSSSAPAQGSGGVSASGVVVAAQQSQLTANQSARIAAVNVAPGDGVAAGQVLVEFDDSAARAQLSQTHAALALAQANFDALVAGPAPELLRQAQAALIIAQAGYSRTLSAPVAADVTAAQAALTAALAAQRKLQAGPVAEDAAAARAALASAQAALQQARSKYDEANRRDPAGIGASPAALALEQATQAQAQAQAAYDKAVKPADDAQLTAARQQVESARAALERLQAPPRDYDIAQARAQVQQAQAQLDALNAKPRDAQLAAAKAQIDAAQAQVRVLEAQLSAYRLVAPMDGTVSRLGAHAGEWATPGQLLVGIADVAHLRIETTDLSERDVPRVQVGQPVTVNVKALGQTLRGTVRAIAPEADRLGGDVVYKVSIDLDASAPGLRAGMSVDVTFEP